jgi:Flp pilus assembly protein TadG
MFFPNPLVTIAGPRRRTSRRGQRPGPGRRRSRRGVAAVEFAMLLPTLMLLFVLSADFARVYYCALTVTNCARSGALYASDPKAAAESPFASITAAALADATNLSPQPTVSSATGTDALGQAYVEVTVKYTFKTVSGYLGSAGNINLVRTVRTAVAPTIPD